MFTGGLCLAKDVGCERVRAGIDERNCGVHIRDFDDGEDGAEDFFGHEGVSCWVGEFEDSGREEEVLSVCTGRDAVWAEELHDAVKVALVDDAAIDIGLGTVGPARIEFLKGVFDEGDELVGEGWGDEDIVYTEASLPSIVCSTPGDFLCCDCEVGVIGNYSGVFPTEFEEGWCEVFCCCSGNDAGNGGIADVGDMIEFLLQNGCCNSYIAVNDRIAFWV